jgi:hypothetical protein
MEQMLDQLATEYDIKRRIRIWVGVPFGIKQIEFRRECGLASDCQLVRAAAGRLRIICRPNRAIAQYPLHRSRHVQVGAQFKGANSGVA